MGGKRYWWLKLPEDFFRQLPMKKLRRIAGGDTYTIIYLKMMLLSLKTEGVISYECAEGDFIENLALDIDEDEENVAVAVAFLTKNSLLENSDDEATKVLPAAINAIGSETAVAERVRRHREKRKQKKALQCNINETNEKRRDREDKREEIEIREEREIDTSTLLTKFSNETSNFDEYAATQNAMFELFWEAYPRKIGKAEAHIAWAGLNVDEELYKKIMDAVQRYKNTKQWQDVDFIPYPVNFLQNERYNDDIKEMSNNDPFNAVFGGESEC